jgi:hypothetical protein
LTKQVPLSPIQPLYAQSESDLPVTATDAAVADSDPTAVTTDAAPAPAGEVSAAAATYRLRCSAARVNVYSRVEQCVYVRSGQVDYFRNGLPVGQVRVQWTRRLRLDPRRTTWGENDSFRVLSVTYAGLGTTLTQYLTRCGGTCRAEVTFSPQVLVPRRSFNASIAFSDTTTTKNQTRATYTLFFDNPQYGLNAITVNSRTFRCDAQINKTRGCVFPSYRSTMTTMATLPHISAHIRQVQAAGPHHYGSKARSNGRYPLSRTTLKRRQTANYATACPASRAATRPAPDPKTGPWSCDEYPFKTTNQGASMTKQPDWGWAWVPVSEQSAQGGRVNAFYRANRILNDDQFWVAV